MNSNTEQPDESWPIEPLAPPSARANKTNKYAIDLLFTYPHTLLDEKTIEFKAFPQVISFLLSLDFFMDLKSYEFFFTKEMSSFFKTLIEQGVTLVYFDEILLLSNSKEHMFQLIEHFHIITTKQN